MTMDDGLASVTASPALARLLLHFAVAPDAPVHLRALQRHLGLGSRSVQRELKRLVEWGVLRRDEADGRAEFRVDPEHPKWHALFTLVRTFAEPTEVVREALSHVPGVEAAFVFGSAARGDAHVGSDVDVFVLGEEIPPADLGRASFAAEVVLGREIDMKRYTRDHLRRAMDRGDAAFLREALGGPKRWIVGSDADLGRG